VNILSRPQGSSGERVTHHRLEEIRSLSLNYTANGHPRTMKYTGGGHATAHPSLTFSFNASILCAERL